MGLTDKELFEAIRMQTPLRDAAISQLREILVRGVSKALASKYGRTIAAEDIVQDALLTILRSIEQFQGASKFVTWAMTIAIRIGTSDLRRRYHAEQSLEAFDTENGNKIEIVAADGEIPELVQSKRELIHLIETLINDRLTEKQRTVIRASLDGFSSDGIAEVLKMNRNAVYKLQHDARVKLKRGLEESGYTADDCISLFVTQGTNV
jgi:RNA polymerase sigma factor (sigma-70 family)